MKRLLCCYALLLISVHGTVVDISNGKLLGSYNGFYYSFFDIPYALPPVGEQRFEDPLPLTRNWTGIRNATFPSVSCVKFAESEYPDNGNENCLTLNVFTKNLNPKHLKTVRVFLYGGGFMVGAAADTDEQYVVREDVVLVIPNYRVGPFGFLSSGDNFVGGNFGLKDQLMALKWVRANIHVFGGKAENVQLTGVSAGAASVQCHLLNPKSWKYFNAAISSSGSVLNRWARQDNPKDQFQNYIKSLGCNQKSSLEVKYCLKNRTKEEHFTATMSLKNFRENPFNLFGIVAELKTAENPFITEHPRVLIKKGQISKSPWVVAYSEREGVFTASEFMSYDNNGKELIEILDSRWRELAPVLLFYNQRFVGFSEALAKKLRDAYSDFLKRKYMSGRRFSAQTYLLMENMFTNELFVNGIQESVYLHRKYSKANVYEYEYRKPLEYSIGNFLSNRSDINFGASHGADMTNVLPLRFLARPNQPSPPFTDIIAKNLIKLGIELSISGNAIFGSKNLPVNNATHTGKLTIGETFFTLESCADGGECTKQDYSYA